MFYVEVMRIGQPLWQVLTYFWCPLFFCAGLILVLHTLSSKQKRQLRWAVPLWLASAILFAWVIYMDFTKVRVLAIH